MKTLKRLRQVVDESQLDVNVKQRLIGLTAAGLLTIGGLTHDLHSGSDEKYHQHMKKTYGVKESDDMLTSLKKIVNGPKKQAMKSVSQILEDSGVASMLGGHGMQDLKDKRVAKRMANPTSSTHHMKFREYLDKLNAKNPNKI